jgi:hypothetical protein
MKNQFSFPQHNAKNNETTATQKGNSGSGVGEDLIWI